MYYCRLLNGALLFLKQSCESRKIVSHTLIETFAPCLSCNVFGVKKADLLVFIMKPNQTLCGTISKDNLSASKVQEKKTVCVYFGELGAVLI